ncbi:MAG: 4a-hydroxytetrahydrobiopterin dehydratase [Pseudomonadota bacterium]|nr:4a-hydroxytetrahydrobiopterin dehydratase [Pseudomonadota bacterium]MDP1903043.1 4a-hydroxytetrahydrobiopterin dehydratase [Pseudomonadota bacterium]MDP2353977.1 4a-hydroxytetrahydrobiopterin dehydratase [Pseudomonadota bacterium]
MVELPEGWEARGKPLALFRRFEFERYSATRTFLDALAALSEASGLHPQNISFGTTYVNITLEGTEGSEPAEQEISLAARINALIKPPGS